MSTNEPGGHRYKLSDIEPLPSIEEEEKAAYPGMSPDSIQREQRHAEEGDTLSDHVPTLAATEATAGGPVIPLASEEAGQID